jgi:hypothetical protein
MRATLSTTLCGLLALVAFVTSSQSDESDPQPEFSQADVTFFEQKVLPVLRTHCFKCHGGKPEVESGFRITSRAGLLKGGELGTVFDAKNREASAILKAIRRDGLEMPPEEPLSAEHVAVLTKWVKLGLPWSKTEDYGVEPARNDDGSDYWAYQQITRPASPAVKNGKWVTNPIDAFVLARLEAAGLAPAGRADRIALIRRAYYDLTGLPPIPADVDRFLADDSPEAWAKVIDHLLESPQYGEKWGRHWLDLVRYAETHGYERDSPKPEAWRYRDYVIQSFNKDKPYNQFIIEQLAGDELPEVTIETLTATGYYRLGIWDDEPADRELARYDSLDDVLKTTSEAVLGMTMGCARCHSHKGDPITHKEYHGFLAYFHDVTYPNRDNIRPWVTDADRKVHEQRLAEKKAREEQMAADIRSLEDDFRAGLKDQLGIETGVTKQNEKVERAILFADSRQQAQKWEYTFEKPSDDWIQTDYSTTSWDNGPGGFGVKGTPGSVVRTHWGTPDIWLRKWFEVDKVPPYLALDLHYDEDTEIYLNGVLVHSTKGYVQNYLRVPLSERALKALKPGRNVIAIHCHQTGGGQYIDAGLVVEPPRFDLNAALAQHGAKVLGKDGVKRLRDLGKQLEQSRKQKPAPPGTRIMAVDERGRAPVHVLLRGNPHAKGPQVGPVVPAALKTRPPELADIPPDGPSGKRLALAKWFFNDDNPLTARVLANRIWQHHFGRGIVVTSNDFGKFGTPPTHPQLLDWLASEVRDGGWALKRIHKLIMLSSTYQMSSRSSEANLAKDPGNDLLWRFNMRRLTAEEIRDTILAATDELNLKQGGPSIYVPIPQAVLQGQSRPGAGWGNSPPAEASRRSVYIHVKRSLLVPIMEIHDQADTDSSCPVRYVTTVPTQSLGMLNGDFTNGKAAKLAERLRKEARGNVPAQIRRAIRLATGRIPDDAEVASDVHFLRAIQSEDKLNEEQALKMYCLLTLNTNEFVYLD